jgi:hypothetical protein
MPRSGWNASHSRTTPHPDRRAPVGRTRWSPAERPCATSRSGLSAGRGFTDVPLLSPPTGPSPCEAGRRQTAGDAGHRSHGRAACAGCLGHGGASYRVGVSRGVRQGATCYGQPETGHFTLGEVEPTRRFELRTCCLRNRTLTVHYLSSMATHAEMVESDPIISHRVPWKSVLAGVTVGVKRPAQPVHRRCQVADFRVRSPRRPAPRNGPRRPPVFAGTSS